MCYKIPVIGTPRQDEARLALHSLLATSFRPAELYRWVCLFDGELDAELSGDGKDPAQFAFEVLKCLLARGMITDVFFDALVDERPNRRDEIEAIRSSWSGGSASGAKRSRSRVPRFEGPRGAKATGLRDFTGRVGPLAELERLLKEPSTVCVVAGGIGGVGKTTLVQEFVARRGAACFPDGSVWLDGQALVGELASISRRFGWSETRDPMPAEVNSLLRDQLEDRHFLLVVDNVDPDVDPSLIPVLGGSCRTLVTSRRTTLYLDLENAASLELSQWSIEECLQFLHTDGLRRPHDTAEELCVLAEFVGRLPLGVRLIASMLRRRPGSSATTVLADLRHQPIVALERHRGKYPGLLATFQVTWDGLTEPGRRVLLAMAACANGTGTDIVGTVAGTADTEDILNELTVRSLVLCTPIAATPWALHDVVRMFVMDQAGFGAVAGVHDGWVIAHQARFADPLHHLEFALGTAQAIQAFKRLVERGAADQAMKIYVPLATHLRQIGKLTTIIRLAESLSRIYHEDSPHAAICQSDLGLGYLTLGDIPRATEHLKCALALEDQFGRLEGQADQLGNLGLCYMTLSDTPRAIEYLERAIAINEKLGRLEGQGSHLGNLGRCYKTRGEIPGAIEIHERALTIDGKLGRLDGQAKHLGNLGVCYKTRGEIPRAIELFTRALEIDEKLGRLEGQASQLGNIGLCYRTLGCFGPAGMGHTPTW